MCLWRDKIRRWNFAFSPFRQIFFQLFRTIWRPHRVIRQLNRTIRQAQRTIWLKFCTFWTMFSINFQLKQETGTVKTGSRILRLGTCRGMATVGANKARIMMAWRVAGEFFSAIIGRRVWVLYSFRIGLQDDNIPLSLTFGVCSAIRNRLPVIGQSLRFIVSSRLN